MKIIAATKTINHDLIIKTSARVFENLYSSSLSKKNYYVSIRISYTIII